MKNASDVTRFSALVLAGDRRPGDPVAALGAAGCKALAPVNGIPMLHRVLATLQASGQIGQITLVGPHRPLLEGDPFMHALLNSGAVTALEPAASPSASALMGLQHITVRPVLVTTADHALLRPEMVDYFLEHSRSSGYDVTVAVTPLKTVLAMFPENRRTAIKLHGGPYCGSNLFTFMTPESERLAAFWRNIEQQRKDPRKVIAKALGLAATLRYLLGTLSLDGAMQRISAAVGMRVGAVVMPFAEAAVDVDSLSDHRLVEKILRQRTES
ncbi:MULTISPECIES: nucleotidyltransferase family protein [Pseudomonas]|uniref:nucleotidyltransferase family protein n=1 Tax=Pseudomonas TaxID=286 RepID=UPI00056FC746|nr:MULTISPECIES: nucleotidyltransferase family protein [Pseudomonas]PNG82001.1 MobA-like NTP transferase domain protein [Pseudomonas putida]QUN70677.1 nucleotidyltransferase family protein [Pseudomonas sp. JS425]URD45542.1 nucleotidyltransferase family protein [Pseudomonas sp. BYT-5]URK95652.1 nucleotidyltransferase family protein [Pseudomonas sp. BYT-1]